jgi:hypothetical protein
MRLPPVPVARRQESTCGTFCRSSTSRCSSASAINSRNPLSTRSSHNGEWCAVAAIDGATSFPRVRGPTSVTLPRLLLKSSLRYPLKPCFGSFASGTSLVNRRMPQPAHDDAARGVSRAEAKSIRVSDIWSFSVFQKTPARLGQGAGVLLLGTHHIHTLAPGGMLRHSRAARRAAAGGLEVNQILTISW